MSLKIYVLNEEVLSQSINSKLTWNKKGQPTKVCSYDENGKTETVERYKYNTKGLLTKYSIYEAEDKSTIVIKYKYNKKGQLIKKKQIGYSGCTEWAYDGNKVTVTEYEDKANNELEFVTYETYEHGDLIKDVKYGGKDGTFAGKSADYKLSTGWHTYKKFNLSAKYRKLVSKQQACLEFIAF